MVSPLRPIHGRYKKSKHWREFTVLLDPWSIRNIERRRLKLAEKNAKKGKPPPSMGATWRQIAHALRS